MIVEEEQIEQNFNRINASVFVNNKQGKGPLTYEGTLGFNYLSNSYAAKESNIAADIIANYALDDDAGIQTGLTFRM